MHNSIQLPRLAHSIESNELHRGMVQWIFCKILVYKIASTPAALVTILQSEGLAHRWHWASSDAPLFFFSPSLLNCLQMFSFKRKF